jgi:hypothetical protein
VSTGYIAPIGVHQFCDGTGVPYAGGKLYTYAAGLATLLATYTDSGMGSGTENSNPIILDSAGRCVIFIPDGTGYKFVLKTSADALVWTRDDILIPSVATPPSPIAVPTGAILPYGGLTAPSGYLLCNGAAVSRTTYAALYAITGDAFGSGDGSTTFNVADTRDLPIFGAGVTYPLGSVTAPVQISCAAAPVTITGLAIVFIVKT